MKTNRTQAQQIQAQQIQAQQTQAQQTQAQQTQAQQTQAQQTQAQRFKMKYGHVITPNSIIELMLSLLPKRMFSSKMRWLDCGAGFGNISKCIKEHLKSGIIDMIELNPECIDILRDVSKEIAKPGSIESNVIHSNFLSYTEKEYDVIVSNPPYNCDGSIKTPTNTQLKKTQDGIVCWRDFIRHSMRLLREGGHAVFIIPSIWMRYDSKYGIYDLLMRENRTHEIYCMNNTTTNKVFNMKAQTPTCIVHVEKTKPCGVLSKPSIYDNYTKRWHSVPEAMVTLPTNGICVLSRMQAFMTKHKRSSLLSSKLIQKTRRPTRHTRIESTGLYKNVKTCKLEKREKGKKKVPFIEYEYSDIPTTFHTERSKLILAHKMYGMPFLDISGVVGVTNADSYILEIEEGAQNILKELQEYLCSPIALFIYEAMRYRMRFLEKEAFAYLPNIMLEIYERKGKGGMNQYLYELFEFTSEEKMVVEEFYKGLRFETPTQTMVC